MKKNRDEYLETDGLSPIYRHLIAHTYDGSLIKKEQVLDEILHPTIRDKLFSQIEEHQNKVKELLQKTFKEQFGNDNKFNIQHKVMKVDYPPSEDNSAETAKRILPETLHEFFQYLLDFYGEKPLAGYRSLHAMRSKEVTVGETKKVWYTPEFESNATIYTYNEFSERVDALARSMQKCFNLESSAGNADLTSFEDIETSTENEQSKHSRFAIFDETSYEWFVTAQALFKQNVTLVTVYASLGIDSLIVALNESKVSGIMVNFASLAEVVPRIANECPKVKYILYNLRMCEQSAEATEKRERILNELNQKFGNRLVLTTVEELIEMGMQDKKQSKSVFSVRGEPHTSSDVAILMYTSGTTSAPKGVLITHHSLLSAISSFNTCLGVERNIEYIHVAFLPLAHILEILVESIMMLRGGMICYSNARTLSEGTALPCGDMKFWRPSLLVGVPKVFDTIKKGAQVQLHGIAEKRGAFLGWLVNTLFDIAYKSKKQAIQDKRDTPFWNWLVFKKFTDGVGGRLRLMLSGGSALVPETQEFLRIGFNSVFLQGYGLTETNAGTAVMNAYTPFTLNNCGPPVPCVEIRLRDVPDMGYTHKDYPHPRGELLVRGENITIGYFKQKDLTKEAYGKLPGENKNTFFETGDIAEILENGSIRIIDRKKNLIKLLHGEYIALNKLESIYGDSPFVQPSGIMVVGDSYKDYPVALILPQHKYVEQVAREMGISFNSFDELLRNPKIVKAVQQSFDALANKAKLANFERVKKVHLCEEDWTIENGMLTATQKLKRPAISERYKKAIQEMYE